MIRVYPGEKVWESLHSIHYGIRTVHAIINPTPCEIILLSVVCKVHDTYTEIFLSVAGAATCDSMGMIRYVSGASAPFDDDTYQIILGEPRSTPLDHVVIRCETKPV
jgi:hypothetical protein